MQPPHFLTYRTSLVTPIVLDQSLGVVSLFKPSRVLLSHNLCASLRAQELAGAGHPFCYCCEYKPRLSLSCPNSDSPHCRGAVTGPSYRVYDLFPLWRCTILSHVHHLEPSKTVSLPLACFCGDTEKVDSRDSDAVS